ncbi:MAG TPA: glycosyltransferase [Steroidobacteraceae bacterium]|nr:glycosyltransferase [Steroidobacteraceae bacterium]
MTASTQRDRLRILQVILSRGFAGSERAAVETCNALAHVNDVAIAVRRDHRNATGASIRDYLSAAVTVFELPALWRTSGSLGAVIDTWRPDVVHTHLRRGTRYVAQLRRPVPHVATLHIDLNGRHYLRADALCCISRWQADKVERAGYAGVSFQIPNSLVPHPRVHSGRRAEMRRSVGAGSGDFLIGGVGRLAEGKGFDVLIEAFRRAALPESRLVIVGEGRQRARLERIASGLPVTFTGFRDDAKDWFHAFDLFVSASRREPFGRVIIEALDAGTPVIASDAKGPRDIAARYPIELSPADDVDSLAAALRRAHGRPRARLAVDLSEFHVDRVAASLLDAYHRLLDSTPPQRVAARAAA